MRTLPEAHTLFITGAVPGAVGLNYSTILEVGRPSLEEAFCADNRYVRCHQFHSSGPYRNS